MKVSHETASVSWQSRSLGFSSLLRNMANISQHFSKERNARDNCKQFFAARTEFLGPLIIRFFPFRVWRFVSARRERSMHAANKKWEEESSSTGYQIICFLGYVTRCLYINVMQRFMRRFLSDSSHKLLPLASTRASTLNTNSGWLSWTSRDKINPRNSSRTRLTLIHFLL